jgi:hypothetical protein
MQEGVFRVALRPEDGSGTVDHYLRRKTTLKDKGSELILEELEVPDMDAAMVALEKAEADIILVSGLEWANMEDKTGLDIAAVLPRRESTWVLISDDKPEYLPRRSIIICPHRLVRRQMRRARRDAHTMSVEDAIEKFGTPEDDTWGGLVPWMSELLAKGDIDAFIIDRGRWEMAGIRNLRHTLGMQRNQRDRAHFIPPTFSGFTLLLSRTGFPSGQLTEMHDRVSKSALKTEYNLWDGISHENRNLIAIHAEQRGVGAILREAEQNEDLPLQESLLDIEGRVMTGGTRIEIRMETVSANGWRTVGLERTAPLDFAYEESIRMIVEWKNLMEVVSEQYVDPENPETKSQFFKWS